MFYLLQGRRAPSLHKYLLALPLSIIIIFIVQQNIRKGLCCTLHSTSRQSDISSPPAPFLSVINKHFPCQLLPPPANSNPLFLLISSLSSPLYSPVSSRAQLGEISPLYLCGRGCVGPSPRLCVPGSVVSSRLSGSVGDVVRP